LSKFSDSIVLVKNQENLGLATSSNIGFKKSKGRYVVRLDADDYVHPSFISTLHLFMEILSNDFDAVSVDYLKVDYQGCILSHCNQKLEPIACGVLYKIEALTRLGLYKEGLRIDEDLEFNSRFKEANLRMGFLNIPLYKYTQHSNSLTAVKHLFI
jgi:glycosyltransferase involved in cell wall biosynthesis